MNRRNVLFSAGAASLFPFSRAHADVAEALAGDRFRVNGEDYQLTDIMAPSAYALHRDHEPFYEDAKAILARRLRGGALTLEETASPSRWREKRVQARLAGEEMTLQEALVTAGAARVAPQTDNYDLIDKLLRLEKEAREDRRGLWALGAYRIFNAADATSAIGGYHLVEGEVFQASEARGRFYINFNADFRTDFTASAPARSYRRWMKDDAFAIGEGTLLRIRGFVARVNGPSIELQHVKQIEWL